MGQTTLRFGGYQIPVFTKNTVVIGTGAAGYNAADRLVQYGQREVAIVTEGVCAGTSRNTGSDKQTYYKLTLSGEDSDSVRRMAQTLFDGQCVDGDHALCEAALSAQSFLKLVELGVPFPHNRYGEYIGYKTDHDPCRRATSVGPYTSKRMTEQLQKAVEQKGIPVFDRLLCVKLLVEDHTVQGLLCVKLDVKENECPFVAFRCKNVVYATGGPAGMYAHSVYPHGHYGASGIAFEAGIKGKNLTEWQYGLASVHPRWNVSGTYMQALPRFVSTKPDGSDEQEFLSDFFTEEATLFDRVFLKGYQWPFDVRKIEDGSSIIDLLVYLELSKGRRVFLDFRQNPGNRPIDFSALSNEARSYLEQAGACFGTPIERLCHMNQPAVDFYRDKGVDLTSEPLEIALCAQHNNGGLSVDAWWQTDVSGVFAVGEAAATHGVYRPGGSALNAGQVGATRAAQYIAAKCVGMPETAFGTAALEQIETAVQLANSVVSECEDNVAEHWERAALQMSRFGGPIRSTEGIATTVQEVKQQLQTFSQQVRVLGIRRVHKAFRLWDMLLCQLVYLQAMEDYAQNGGNSRGSALYTDRNGRKPYRQLPEEITFVLDDGSRGNLVQEVMYTPSECSFLWRTVRPIPEEDDFFENVWRNFRQNKNIN